METARVNCCSGKCYFLKQWTFFLIETLSVTVKNVLSVATFYERDNWVTTALPAPAGDSAVEKYPEVTQVNLLADHQFLDKHVREQSTFKGVSLPKEFVSRAERRIINEHVNAQFYSYNSLRKIEKF